MAVVLVAGFSKWSEGEESKKFLSHKNGPSFKQNNFNNSNWGWVNLSPHLQQKHLHGLFSTLVKG